MGSILFHGSDKVVEYPTLQGGRIHNDFGQGFYCTPDINLAREWACSEHSSAFVNHYSFEPSIELRICNLLGPEYHVLNWLAILMNHRVFSTRHPLMKEIKAYILKEFLPDLSGFDIVRGYRADDSYFDIAESFLAGSLSLEWLQRALKLGNLGEQVFLQSQKAFDALVFTTAEPVERELYYLRRIQRDQNARKAFKQIKDSGADGVLAVDLLRNQWKNNDERLR